MHLLSFQFTKNNALFSIFTFCIDHDRIIPTTKAIKVHVCLATKPKTLLRKNKMVPATFSTRAVNASLSLLASRLRTFAFYLIFFSNTPITSGGPNTEEVKPFYLKVPLSLIASLKKSSYSGGDWSMPRKFLRYNKFIF